jgi:formylglycine-generating enzyme
MKTLPLRLVAFLLLGVLEPTSATPNPQPPDPTEEIKVMTQRLSLTTSQQDAIRPILVSEANQRQSIQDDPNLSDKTKHDRIGAIHRSVLQKIKALFTPAQIALIEQGLAHPTPSSTRPGLINMAFSTVGDPGNANDSTGLGRVTYTYNIGTYDVTTSQYAAFLNAVAATDPYGLYNANMAADLNVATILQSGSSGTYTYAVIGTGNQPVTFVGWFDAARFANWMHNGQPRGTETNGTTETGAYTLNGAMSGVSVTKNSSAKYWIPSENEWYKAAYYDPTLKGTGDYWLYPTQSNTAPGNQIGATPNQANIYSSRVFSVTQNGTYSKDQYYLTDVGAYSGSASHYGTFDQGGDTLQWNDTVNGTTRDIQGGSWPGDSNFLKSSYRASFDPTGERQDFGFRLASTPK